MIALGIIIGFIVGALALGWTGGIAGGFVGFIVALAWRSRTQARERMQRAAPGPSPGAPKAMRAALSTANDDAPNSIETMRRLTAIELRIEALERRAGIDIPRTAAEAESPEVTVPFSVLPAATAPAMPATTTPSRWAKPATEAPAPAAPELPGFAHASDGTQELQRPDVPAATAISPPLAAVRQRETRPPAPVNPLWAWFTGGNALTRIGVVVLFFGVAFLLRYFAEFITIPIGVKLLGVAVAGGALIALGAWLARTRPGYGLSLEGAGAGILYLTTFAAFRLYDVLPAAPAFALLVMIAAFTVALAVRADSQPLVGLAIAGGFLAPFLVSTSAGSPVLLFGYFAVLNAAIFALAWLRAWRALNALGFVFTFALGLFWGERFYRPEHFATVEPFLALFFVFYVTIAILYAKRVPLQASPTKGRPESGAPSGGSAQRFGGALIAPVDALLVFGMPLVGFALQAGLVHDTRYGVAWSALCVAAVYGALAAALWRRPEPGLSLLARAFFVLAIIFATVAIPFAADPRWTTGWWALEGAAVYWIGCRQRQGVARAFALLLQVGAAVAFAASGFAAGERLFFNATFLGTTMIALAALTTAFVADRHRDAISGNERALVPWLVVWGLAWWYGGAALDLVRALPARAEGNAMLAFVVASTVCASLLRRWLRWSRLAWFGAALLPVMAIVAFADWERMRTSLLVYGWLVWPLAWVTHWGVLRAADALREGEVPAGAPAAGIAGFLGHAHTASAIAAVAWVAWEASEWVGRVFPEGTVWMPCAAAWPAIVYLALIARTRDWHGWPFAAYRDAYATSAATAIAALLAVWFALVNVISPGGTEPLPYAPIANPLDVTLIAALVAVFVWTRGTLHATERVLYAWWGAAVFLLVNAIVFRAVHQWLDVPWRLSALLGSKPLQAALTLTWTATALPLMLVAGKRAIRPLWMVGAGLLAIVVVKLFALDLNALSGLSRVVAFIGVGVLLLIIGYLAPLPPTVPAKGDLPT